MTERAFPDLQQLLSMHYYENSGITQINRLPAHAPFHSWRECQDARDDATSDRQRVMNGEWGFSYFSSPQSVPSNRQLPALLAEAQAAPEGSQPVLAVTTDRLDITRDQQRWQFCCLRGELVQ